MINDGSGDGQVGYGGIKDDDNFNSYYAATDFGIDNAEEHSGDGCNNYDDDYNNQKYAATYSDDNGDEHSDDYGSYGGLW